MDPVVPPLASTDEQFLFELGTLARRYAGERMTRDAAADLAQDIVLEHLVKLRAGARFNGIASMEAYTRNVVRRRAINAAQREKRSARRSAEHTRELLDSPRAWMSPDLALEERELHALHTQALASLPNGCRRVFTMVREAKTSYQVIATRAGVSRSMVNRYVVKAQHHFRRELEEYGIVTPAPRSRPRAAKAGAR